MELHLCNGEPTLEELAERARIGNHQIGYRVECPNCDHSNTSFIRQGWWMCHDCLIAFNSEDY